jgi:tetratricopeptide (TPR) repeat protein
VRKGRAVSRFAFDHLEQARKLLEQEKHADAIAVLDQMARQHTLSDQERALMWQTYGYVYSSQPDYEAAADSFENCLLIAGLEEEVAADITYNLAQLYVVLERYDRAIELFLKWLELVEKPPPRADYVIAVAYAQSDRVDDAIPHAERAVAKSKAPKEAWLQLLLALYVEKKRYVDSIGVLEDLLRRYPKKLYWKQLSGVHAELRDDRKALAALELAYLEDEFSDGGDLLDLARLYLHNDLPFKAASAVQDGLSRGVLDEDAQAWQMVADSLIQAREYKKALDPLRKAAELSANGELYVRLARLHVREEEWSKAIAALHKALGKGRLRAPGRAYLLLGIASAHDRRWEEAERAFGKAQKSESTKKAAAQWMGQLQHRKELSQMELAQTPEREADGHRGGQR